MLVKFKRLAPHAIQPDYATAGSACFDLHALNTQTINTGTQAHIKTGLAMEIPAGHVMLIFARSGNASKHRLSLSNSVGVIDEDYRGEIIVMIRNDHIFDYEVKRGDRIAQAMIVPTWRASFAEGELSETERGIGGFGSTGK